VNVDEKTEFYQSLIQTIIDIQEVRERMEGEKGKK
jgi:hypothetical protein